MYQSIYLGFNQGDIKMKMTFNKLIMTGSIILASGFSHAGVLVDEDFDPIDSSMWNISNGAVLGAGNPEFFDGNALYFGRVGRPDTGRIRTASTTALDMSAGGSVSFEIKLGGDKDTYWFEKVDQSYEQVVFGYSLDNGNSWVDEILYNDPNGSYSDNWITSTASFAAGALNNSTIFRWAQLESSASPHDSWAVDNVVISSNATPVSEPASLLLFGLGLASLGLARRKKT